MQAISSFRDKNVLVLGDLILDHYIWGDVERISPEAPVPVVWLKKEDYFLGGAANVANNIRDIGAIPIILGVIGKDFFGEVLRKILRKRGISTEGLISIDKRPTTLKTRVIAHQQQVVRIDREEISGLDDKITKKILEFIRKKIKKIEAIIIEDYGKGLISPDLIVEVLKIGKRFNKIISVDPKEEHFSYYQGVDVITPNKKEASIATGIRIKTFEDIKKAGETLSNTLKIKTVLITLGEEGMLLSDKGRFIAHIPTVAQEVFDVTGAGDTVVSIFTLGLISGLSSLEAATLANYTAGIVVGKLGASTVSPRELKERIKKI